MQSKNFSSNELMCRHCKKAGITPAFLSVMQEFRDFLGKPLTVTSAYRCPDHPIEKAKGAAPGRHTLGVAVDWFCPELNLQDLYREVERFGKFQGVGVSIQGNFIHCDTRDRRTRWQYLRNGTSTQWDGRWGTLTLAQKNLRNASSPAKDSRSGS
jgi:uncharacterized protein YcbK (DUF882 family)